MKPTWSNSDLPNNIKYMYVTHKTGNVYGTGVEYVVEQGEKNRPGAISSPKKPLSTLAEMDIIFIVCTLILAPSWLANIERKIL